MSLYVDVENNEAAKSTSVGKKVEGGTRTNGKKSGGVDEIRVAPFKSNDSMAMVAATN
jgi:hypothetical protein